MKDQKIKFIGDQPREIDEIGKIIAVFGGKKNKAKLYDFLIDRIGVISSKTLARDEKLFGICSLLKDFTPNFDWVGFYIKSKKKENELVLGPYAGKATEHTKIPFGKGICGQAAITKEPMVIQDVSKEKNYLSCGPDVKSEIVIPILKDGEFVAELDIDSFVLSPFDEKEKEFLARVGHVVGKIF